MNPPKFITLGKHSTTPQQISNETYIHKADYINKEEFSLPTATCYLTIIQPYFYLVLQKGLEVKSTWPGLMSRLTKGNNPQCTKVAPDLMLSKMNYVLHNASMA